MGDMLAKYILEGQKPVVCPDLLTWGRWMEIPGNRIVAQTRWQELEIFLSTVFLGINHSWDLLGRGPPILFETMVFGGPLDDEQQRYATWDEAVAGHEALRLRIEEALANPDFVLTKKEPS